MIAEFNASQFCIFFRYHLRRIGLTPSQYALKIGISSDIVEGVFDGVLYPPEKILREMGVSAEETFKWETENKVNEI